MILYVFCAENTPVQRNNQSHCGKSSSISRSWVWCLFAGKICIQTNTQRITQTRTLERMHTHTWTFAHHACTRTHAYTHTHAHARTHTRMRTHTHTHTGTHTHPLNLMKHNFTYNNFMYNTLRVQFHDFSIACAWLIRVCGITHLNVWYDLFIYVTCRSRYVYVCCECPLLSLGTHLKEPYILSE